MFNKKQKIDAEEVFSNLSIPAFGYELIRETLIKDILGKDYHSILYWGGKNLARKFPFNSIEDVILFFRDAGWGELVIQKESKSQLLFELTSELISNRFDKNVDYCYQLEAGFLAEQIKSIFNNDAETMEKHNKKGKTITFTVQWE